MSTTMDAADALDDESRRRFRRLLVASLGVHGALLVLSIWAPSFAAPPPGIPGVVTVDLVAAFPGPAPGPPQAAPTAAPPKPAPAPKPIPKPEPPKAAAVPVKPLPPKPDKVVLPKQATKAPEKAPPPKAKTPAKQVDYDDLMKQLRSNAGESRPEAVQTARPAPAATGAPAATATGGGGGGGGTVQVSPQVLAWMKAAELHVRKNWVRAPGFQQLVTTLLVELDEGGNVVGEPKVGQRSGNPFYDDSVVRAIQKASPLPRPPMAGRFTFVFPSEEAS